MKYISLLFLMAIVVISFNGSLVRSGSYGKKCHEKIYPRIRYEEYSKKKFNRSLNKGVKIIVVVRSKYSVWSPDLLDKFFVREAQFQGELTLLDLVWEWDSKNMDAEQFFSEFGFSKEAFVVFYNPQRKERKIIRVDELANDGLPNLW